MFYQFLIAGINFRTINEYLRKTESGQTDFLNRQLGGWDVGELDKMKS